MGQKLFSRQHGLAGILLYAGSAVLFLGGIAGIGFLRADRINAFAVLALAAIPLSWWTFSIARRMRVIIFPNVAALERYLERRSDKLFLFLREFSTDRAIDHHRSFSGFSDLFVTEEERLAAALRAYGTVVAIGRPGEKLPGAGSARLYASDDAWQSVAADLIDRADLIVFRPGKGAGIGWELEQIVARNKLSRTAILPPASKQDHEAIFQRLAALLPPVPPAHPEPTAIFQTLLASAKTEDERRSAEQLIEEARRNMQALAEFPRKLRFIGRLVLIGATDFQPIGGEINEAVTTLAKLFGFSRKRGSDRYLLAGVLLVFAGPAWLLSDTVICSIFDQAACSAFYEQFGVRIFIALVAALFLFLHFFI